MKNRIETVVKETKPNLSNLSKTIRKLDLRILLLKQDIPKKNLETNVRKISIQEK